MLKEKKYIGFDLGAESGRCTVAVFKDNKITLTEVHRFVTHNVKYSGGFHWDILAIYKEIIEGISNAVKKYGPEFDGVGVDTWGVDYVLIDSEDRILSYPYHYRDDRTDNIMDEAFNIVSKNEIYALSGIQFAQFNTVFQLLAESRRKLNLLTVADKMLLMPDYLNFLLCGKKKAEYSIASTTGLIDPVTRNWSWELIDKFGFPRSIFPEVTEPGTKLGNILPSISQLTGISSNVPVYASACHDTASAVVSVPADGGTWAFLSSGTWSLMGIELKEPFRTEKAFAYNFTNEGGVEKTIRFLKNILGFWPLQECRRYWIDKGKEYTYPQLVQFAKEYGHANAWVDLNDQRFLKAGHMPEKITAYLKETNQPVKDEPGFITAVILESLAYSYRNTIKEIEDAAGVKIEKLHAVGGGIQNELLNQYTADAIGKPLYTGPVEGTIIGNAGVQLIASGAVRNLAEWRKIVRVSFEINQYEPAGSDYFNQNESNFNKVLMNNL